MIGIYKITSPTNRIYVGQSRDVEKRFLAYARKNGRGQIKLNRSFIKHGRNNHIFEIIEECLFEELNIRERYWQDFYEVITDKGLNCILTETRDLPREVSDDTRKKLSESNPKYWLGKKRTEETLLKMSSARKGETKPPRSIEHKQNISISKLGDKNGMFGKTGALNATSKKVICTETNKIWDSITECAKDIEINYNLLIKYLTNKHPNKTTIIYLKDYEQK